jgi:hypothetical protein
MNCRAIAASLQQPCSDPATPQNHDLFTREIVGTRSTVPPNIVGRDIAL